MTPAFNSFVVLTRILTISIILILSTGSGLSAQQKKYQSSSRGIDSSYVVKGWLDKAEKFVGRDNSKAFEHIDKALTTSLNNGFQSQEARCYFLLGNIYLQEEQPDLAKGYLEESSRIYEALGDSSAYHESERVLAQALDAIGDLQIAQQKLERGRDWAISNSDVVAETQWNYDLADNYRKQGSVDKSSRLSKRNVDVADSLQIGAYQYTYNLDYANDLIEKNELDSARIFLNNGLIAGNATLDLEPDIAYEALDRVSESYLRHGLADSALAVRQQFQGDGYTAGGNSIQLEPEYQAINALEIGNIYLDNAQLDEAIGQFRTTLSLPEVPTECKEEALLNLTSAYAQNGMDDLAYSTLSEWTGTISQLQDEKEQRLKDNISIHTSLNNKIQRIQLLEKDKEISSERISRLEQEALYTNQRFNNMLIVVIALFGGLLLAIMVLYNRNRANQKEKIANQLIALKSLRSQMNPHFIFNALNSVNSFIAKSDERMANRYLADFSSLMRRVLSYSDKDFIELGEELELLQVYLKLEHERFPDKFEYRFDIEEGLASRDISLPPMLIQPFVENAIWHGLRYLETPGELVVSINQQQEDLEVRISDSGIGRTRSKELKTQSQNTRESVGISNIENRLALLGEIYGSRLQVDIADLNEDGTGTVVTLKIPTNLPVHG